MSPTRPRRGCSYRVDYLHFSAITAISGEARQVSRDQRLTTLATTDPTHRRAVGGSMGTVMAVEKLCRQRIACIGQRALARHVEADQRGAAGRQLVPWLAGA